MHDFIALLDDHDGDDRCGCLRLALWEAIHTNDPNERQTRAWNLLTRCLATHPSGTTMHHQFNQSLDQ